MAEVSENMGTAGQGETTEQPQILYVTTAVDGEVHESEVHGEENGSESPSQKHNGDTKAMFLTHPQNGDTKQIILNHPGKPGRTRKMSKRQSKYSTSKHSLKIIEPSDEEEEEEEETPKKKKRSEGHLFEHFGNYIASLLEVLPKKNALDMQGKITSMLLNEHSRLA